MIKEIIKFENIGTPNYLVELSHLANKNLYNENNIRDFFINKRIDGNTIFDGGICLLKWIDFFDVSNDKILIIPNKYQHFLRDDRLLTNKIVSLFIDKWAVDDSFDEIFNHNTVYHDMDLSVVIDNSAFKFKYSKLKQFLIDFNVIDAHSFKENCFCVRNKYKKIFDKKIILEIKKRAISLEEFKRQQNIKNKHGEEAEIFVLKSEKQKFYRHSLIDAIEQISHVDASAGYDISSFQNNDSTTIDKFIEVKSYSEKPYFYWSKNEMKVAKKEKDNYFLYLVNRDEMNDKNYQPQMFQNPYKNILNDKNWQKDCQNWMFNFKQ